MAATGTATGSASASAIGTARGTAIGSASTTGFGARVRLAFGAATLAFAATRVLAFGFAARALPEDFRVVTISLAYEGQVSETAVGARALFERELLGGGRRGRRRGGRTRLG